MGVLTGYESSTGGLVAIMARAYWSGAGYPNWSCRRSATIYDYNQCTCEIYQDGNYFYFGSNLSYPCTFGYIAVSR